jgi:hypothetical protein
MKHVGPIVWILVFSAAMLRFPYQIPGILFGTFMVLCELAWIRWLDRYYSK